MPIKVPSPNPYFGILSSVDYIVVTADSISMCSEATSSGKPVYIFYDDKIVEDTHIKIVSYLIKKGYARLFEKEVNLEKFSYTTRNSAKGIAEKVQNILLQSHLKRFQERNIL